MSVADPPLARSPPRAFRGHLGMLGEINQVTTTSSSSSSAGRLARRPRTTLSPSPPRQNPSYLLDEGDGLPGLPPEEDPRREALRRSASGHSRETLKDVRPAVVPPMPAPSPASPARRTRRAPTISDDGKPPVLHKNDKDPRAIHPRASCREGCTQRASLRTSPKDVQNGPSSLSSASAAEIDRFNTQREGGGAFVTPSRAPSSDATSLPASIRTRNGKSEQRLAELRLRIRKAAEGASELQRRNTTESLSRPAGTQIDGMSARERLRERRRRREAEQQQQQHGPQQQPCQAEQRSSASDHEKTPAAPTTSHSGLSRRHSTYDVPSPCDVSVADSPTFRKHARSARLTASSRGTTLSSPGPQRGKFVHYYDSSDESKDVETPSQPSGPPPQPPSLFEPNPFNAVDCLTAKAARPSCSHRSSGVPPTPSPRATRKPLQPDPNRRNLLQPENGDSVTQKSDRKVQVGKDDAEGLSAKAPSRRSEASSDTLASLEASLARLSAKEASVVKTKARKRYSQDAIEVVEGTAPPSDLLSTDRRVAPRAVSHRSDSETKIAARGTNVMRSQPPDAFETFEDAQQGVKSGSARSHTRRLLRSERGLDEAGNSPRRLPIQCPPPPPLHSSLHLNSDATRTASRAKVPLPSFLDRARAAKAKSGIQRNSKMSVQSPTIDKSSHEQLSLNNDEAIASDDHRSAAEQSPSRPEGHVNSGIPTDRQQLIVDHIGHLMEYRWSLSLDTIEDMCLKQLLVQAKRLEVEGKRPMAGCVVLVDVLHEDGRDASKACIEQLGRLGAVATNQLPDDGFKGLFTHFVTKNGRPCRLRSFHMLPDNLKPVLVGLSWIHECLEARGWAYEEKHLQEVGREAIRALLPKPHMEELTAESFVGPIVMPPALEWTVPVRFVGMDLSVQPPRHRPSAAKMLLRSYTMPVFDGWSETERLGRMDLIEALVAAEGGETQQQIGGQNLWQAARQGDGVQDVGEAGGEHQDDSTEGLVGSNVTGREGDVSASGHEDTFAAQEDLIVAADDGDGQEGDDDNLAQPGNADDLATMQWHQGDYNQMDLVAEEDWQFGEGGDGRQQDPAGNTPAEQGADEQRNQFAPAQTVEVAQSWQELEPAAAVQQPEPPAATSMASSEPGLIATATGLAVRPPATPAIEALNLVTVSAAGLSRLTLAWEKAVNGQWYHRHSARIPSPLRSECVFETGED